MRLSGRHPAVRAPGAIARAVLRRRTRTVVSVLSVGGLTAGLLLGAAGPSSATQAPGAPGQAPTWAPADKEGFGTSRTTGSKVWYTLQNGDMSEVFYPDLGTPSVRDFQYVVSDGETFAEKDGEASVHRTRLVDPRALVYEQTDTAKSGKWRLTKTYVTDPDRSTVLTHVELESLTGDPLQLYALYNPRLSNSRRAESDDTGRISGAALLAQDRAMGTALVSSPSFTSASNGYLGTSDGWQDLKGDFSMDWRFDAPEGGNLVQTGRIPVTGLPGSTTATVVLGFADDGSSALKKAETSLGKGYQAVSRDFAAGWHAYVAGLKHPPASLRTERERTVYDASVMVLSAVEDKSHRGAFVASPTMPWSWGTNPDLEDPSGAYHLVWARDVSGKAGGLMTAGDDAAAERALDYLFHTQQKPDGSFPQNSTVDGTEHWTNTQMDEVADPIVLAWTLGRKDAGTWSHVRSAADYITANGPVTKQERWENQGGYSPATIGTEIASLVCAADIAEANGDTGRARSYLATADDWQAKVKGWTVTANGPFSSRPYFLRITKDGKPDSGTTYDIGDSGPSAVDQRAVVDTSFLELVRLGVLSPKDPAVLNSLKVVDRQLGEQTPSGQLWHRYNFDGYGETATGADWNFGFPKDSRTTQGRLWPLFAGERGEYELAAGRKADSRLATMAATATEGGLLPEQVWDNQAPAGTDGFLPGRPSHSATPLGWAHGQFIRLAWSIQEDDVISRPTIVACRYQHICPSGSDRGAGTR